MAIVVRISLVVAGVVGLLFGIPMLFVPGPWADLWGWHQQERITAHLVGSLLTTLGISALLGLRRPEQCGLFASTIALSGLIGFGAMAYTLVALETASNMWYLAGVWLALGVWFAYLVLRYRGLRPI